MKQGESKVLSKKIRKGLLRVASFLGASLFCFFLLVFFFQEVLIFPGLLASSKNAEITTPNGAESFFVNTTDGESINAWRLAAFKNEETKKTALIFHGNADSLRSAHNYQKFFKSLGITSYIFSYRGYGLSSGWPSEEGLYLDGSALTEEILRRENIDPKELIVVGVSIGTGPASFIAKKYSVGTLILYSPYTSLPDLIKEKPLSAL